ncbi:pyrroline-5-carboxylate reductase [Clostridiales bacterium BX7]|uniref:Pyrroline-5-carboxylate reductase n=2 Tax=Feifania hominis TaxID=2763660 RepID=A0A926HU51_9FIRM|nr:pyrroline-5-carboxylate reductase [Feifania hominis]
MAYAIASGLVEKNFPCRLFHFDRDSAKYVRFESIGSSSCWKLEELLEACDTVFFAVKPQNFDELLAQMNGFPTGEKLFVSIAAGISTGYLAASLGRGAKIVRAMPNTPLLVSMGATALCANEQVTPQELCYVQQIFSQLGVCEIIEEELMNAIIAVNGSSPAVVYLFVKAFVDGAKEQGIDEQLAFRLFCQSVLGSVEMLQSTGKSPEELIRMVTSPGGTTLAILDSLEQSHFSEAIADSMRACTRRAQEIGK